MTMEKNPQMSSTNMTPEPSFTTPTTRARHNSSATDVTSKAEVVYISTSAPSTGNVTVVHVNITTPYTGVISSATTFTQNSSKSRTWPEICCTSSAESSSRENNYTGTDTFTSALISKATATISNVSATTIIVKGRMVQAISTTYCIVYCNPMCSTL